MSAQRIFKNFVSYFCSEGDAENQVQLKEQDRNGRICLIRGDGEDMFIGLFFLQEDSQYTGRFFLMVDS